VLFIQYIIEGCSDLVVSGSLNAVNHTDSIVHNWASVSDKTKAFGRISQSYHSI